MDFLLFCGPPNCGKSTAIENFLNYLLSPAKGYIIIHRLQTTAGTKCIVEKSGKQILFWCETDQVGSINALSNYYQQKPGIDAVVCASRDVSDNMRTCLFKTLDISNPSNYYFEIPMGRMKQGLATRSATVPWYLGNVQKVAEVIGGQAPFLF